MAIDILSNPEFLPIIVGDDAEVAGIQGLSADVDGRYHLLVEDQEIALTDAASDNFRKARHVLLVGLTETDSITMARCVKIENIQDGKDLSRDQRRALSKALSLGAGAQVEFSTEPLAEFWRSYPELSAA